MNEVYAEPADMVGVGRRERVGWLQYGSLGDVLLSTAVLRDWRVDNPDAFVTWFVLDRFRHAVMNNPDVDSVVTLPSPQGPFSIPWLVEAWPQIKWYAAANSDRVVSSQHFPEHPDGHGHLLDQMYRHAGVRRRDNARIVFRTAGRDFVEASRVPGLFDPTVVKVAVCARSVTEKPVWPDEWYTRLAESMPDVRFYCGDADIPGMTRVDLTLGAWAHAIYWSDVYLGLNTGSTWLATTTSTPIVSMWSHAGHGPGFTSLRDSWLGGPLKQFDYQPSVGEVEGALRFFLKDECVRVMERKRVDLQISDGGYE